jgi:hypothetical protein
VPSAALPGGLGLCVPITLSLLLTGCLRWRADPDLACLCKDHSMPTFIACRNGA